MSIYTKKGDKGETDLFDVKTGKKIKVSKDSPRLEVIGTIDELSSILGITVTLSEEKKDKEFIQKIQKDLFKINSIIAGVKKITFPKTKVSYLKKKIDQLEKNLPKLNKFILPGGTLVSSYLHLARSITRKAERSLVGLIKEKKLKNDSILAFLNRLSDLLFMLARESNSGKGVKEAEA